MKARKTRKMTMDILEPAATYLKKTSSKLEIKAGEGRTRLVSPGKIVSFLVEQCLDESMVKRLEKELLEK